MSERKVPEMFIAVTGLVHNEINNSEHTTVIGLKTTAFPKQKCRKKTKRKYVHNQIPIKLCTKHFFVQC